MVAEFGYGMLVVTLAVTLYAIGAALYGGIKKIPSFVESARLAMLLTLPLVTLVAISIITLLVTHQYSVAYVYAVTSDAMPLYLKITALWGGQAGSLVFWAWLMSIFATAATLRKWDRDREFLPWVIVVTMVTLAFFLAMIVLFENPFERFWLPASGGEPFQAMFQPAAATLFTPADGRGLNPLLRHPGMIIHPPMLYLGFVSFVIPFAFAISALIAGRSDDRWIRLTRRWALIAWLFLSLGLVLGMRWAYDVLGWGGYWGWDPVEVAALMPWLSGTAFLHSVMIQEKRALFKRWNMVLIIVTYALVIFGTFLTRSGVLSSVHAFAQSAIGPMFFAFIGVTFSISLGLLLMRWNTLRSEGQMTSLLSRESLFLFNNLLFMGILVVCFIGVVFPIFSELITNQKMTVGADWYERITGPLWAGLLLLMGIAPLAAWRHSTGKTLGRAIWKPLAFSAVVMVVIFALGIRQWAALLGFFLVTMVASVTLYEYGRAVVARSKAVGENLFLALWHLAGKNRRRYGGYIIHLGVVMMALGIIGIELFQTQTQGTLKLGQSLDLAGYSVTFNKIDQWDTPISDGRNVTRAELTISKNGKSLMNIAPRRDYFYDSQQTATLPGVRSTYEDDVYVLLVDWQPITADSATFRVYHNPLVKWLWLGAWIFIFGTMVAAWPDKDPELARVKATRRATVASKA